jgi:protein-tyrosine phosphatase
MPPVEPATRQTVLIVCFGNLCRSPMAEALLRAALPRREWNVVSAGTHAMGGSPPTRGACDAIYRIAGLDIEDQRSQPLTIELLRESEFTFTMSRQQALEAAALHPGAAHRIRLLGAFAPAGGDGPANPDDRAGDGIEIADPMGGDEGDYAACCRRIAACAQAAARWLKAGGDRAQAPLPVDAWLSRR